jgi:hypothetical protein
MCSIHMTFILLNHQCCFYKKWEKHWASDEPFGWSYCGGHWLEIWAPVNVIRPYRMQVGTVVTPNYKHNPCCKKSYFGCKREMGDISINRWGLYCCFLFILAGHVGTKNGGVLLYSNTVLTYVQYIGKWPQCCPSFKNDAYTPVSRNGWRAQGENAIAQ